MAENSFWRPLKTVVTCDLFIMIIIIIIVIIIFIISIFGRVFSECTEAINISLIPLKTILPEEYALIIGFRFTLLTKMQCFDGSIADGAPFKFLLTHQNREGKGHQKGMESK